MLAMPVQLDRYVEISVLSARMVEAARGRNWEQLLDLERNVAALRERMREDSVTSPGSPDAEPEVARMRGLIQQILDDDAEVRRHTEPWMEQVRLLLSGHLSDWRVSGSASSTGAGTGRGSGA